MPDNPRTATNRDIVVVGASAGGVEALRALAKSLPGDFPASVFVVLHVGSESVLAGILHRAGQLPAANARDGEAIRRSRIYVAPCDRHMLLHDGVVLVRRGPKENMARPAIDPLFRSAARWYGSRAIGVILTGGLSDGTAGLHAVKRCGGVAVVQDPEEAQVPSMPRSALRHVAVDYCEPIEAIGPLLVRLASEPARPQQKAPENVEIETAIAEREETIGEAPMKTENQLGRLAPLSCPECNGPLWEIEDGKLLRFRCHTGHAYNADVLLAANADETERLLWNILRDYEQRGEIVRRMIAHEQEAGHENTTRHLDESRGSADEKAALIRRLIDQIGKE